MSTDLTIASPSTALAAHQAMNREQVELLKATICKGATDNELKLFQMVCQRTGLDPFARQIHAVKRRAKDEDTGQWTEVMSFQTGIDGFRLIAERTGLYEGQTAAQWCGEDGQWRDIWTAQTVPFAARVGVYRKGFREPIYGIAHYCEYVQEKRDGTPVRMWAKMACTMLAKCAEAQAMRKAFPQETSGIYEPAEMVQATVADEKQLPTAQPLRWASKGEMLAEFKDLKAHLGDERFYTVLGRFGVEDAKGLKLDGASEVILMALMAEANSGQ